MISFISARLMSSADEVVDTRYVYFTQIDCYCCSPLGYNILSFCCTISANINAAPEEEFVIRGITCHSSCFPHKQKWMWQEKSSTWRPEDFMGLHHWQDCISKKSTGLKRVKPGVHIDHQCNKAIGIYLVSIFKFIFLEGGTFPFPTTHIVKWAHVLVPICVPVGVGRCNFGDNAVCRLEKNNCITNQQ